MPAWNLTRSHPGLDRDPLEILSRIARDLTKTPSSDRVPPGTSLGPTRDYGGPRLCNTPSPLRLGLSHFFFYNKIFAKIHKVYQST
jgi:hypothetical protein